VAQITVHVYELIVHCFGFYCLLLLFYITVNVIMGLEPVAE